MWKRFRQFFLGLPDTEPPEADTSRVRRFEVPVAAVAALFTTHGPVTLSVKGIPPDAQITDGYYDPLRRVFGVYVKHASFDPVLWGQIIPVMADAEFTRHYRNGRAFSSVADK